MAHSCLVSRVPSIYIFKGVFPSEVESIKTVDSGVNSFLQEKESQISQHIVI